MSAKVDFIRRLIELGASDDVILAACGEHIGEKRRKERRNRLVARGLMAFGWLSWALCAIFVAETPADQAIIGLSELALIYEAWNAMQLADPEAPS